MVDLDELERFFKERVEVHRDPPDPYDSLPQNIKDYDAIQNSEDWEEQVIKDTEPPYYVLAYVHKSKSLNKKTHSEKIGLICTKIHDHCFNLLFNISLKLNNKYHKNPDNINKEIIIDTERVSEKNSYNMYELY